MKHNPNSLLTLAFASSILITGCSTTRFNDGAETEISSIDVAKGSSTADLVAAMGEPISVETYEPDPNVEIWSYDLTKSRVDMVGVETEEIPYVHPITGIEQTITEAVYKPQTTTQTQLIKVFVVAETVIGWKVETNVERVIAN